MSDERTPTSPEHEGAMALNDAQTVEPGGQDEAPTTGEETSPQDEMMARLKEVIDVSKELVGPLRYRMRITVPRSYIDEKLESELNELQREAVIPGFRKGRAPMSLVEKRFAPDVADKLVDTLLATSFMAAADKEKLDPIGDPVVQISIDEERTDDSGMVHRQKVLKFVSATEAMEKLKLPREGPFEYTCEVEVRPEFEIPELEGIPIKLRRIEVTDEDVQAELDRILMRYGNFEPVEDGPVREDDLLYADVKMFVDGALIKTLENEDMPARGSVIEGVPLPDLGKAVIGKMNGETTETVGTIPNDYENVDLRGKNARFEIKIREIKRLVVPPLTDEIAREWGFESADFVRVRLKERLQSDIEQRRRREQRQQIEDYLVEKTAMELPPELSQRQTDRLLARRMVELYRLGIPDAEVEKRMDQMRISARQSAVRDLKVSFVMDKIADLWKIKVSEEEINGAIAMIAAQQGRRFDRVRDDLSRNDGLDVLYTNLRDAKIADRLLEKAVMTEESG